jgi:hypothetical protein
MDLSNTIDGHKKLNNSNYIYYNVCIESYLQCQDLWEVVDGSETTSSELAKEATMTESVEDPKIKEKMTLSVEKHAETLQKWKIKIAR